MLNTTFMSMNTQYNAGIIIQFTTFIAFIPGYYEQLLNPLGFDEIIPSFQQKNRNGFYLHSHLKNEMHVRRNTISQTGNILLV